MRINWNKIGPGDYIYCVGDYMLRVEKMRKRRWWWQVYYLGEGLADGCKEARSKLEAMTWAESTVFKHMIERKTLFRF